MAVHAFAQAPGAVHSVVVDEQIQTVATGLSYVEQDVGLAAFGTRLKQRLRLQVARAVEVDQVIAQYIRIDDLTILNVYPLANESIVRVPRALNFQLGQAAFD